MQLSRNLSKQPYISFLSCVLLLFSVNTISGCATEPGQTTGIGALAGGVLGAGLGVIVGSQTGDPGTGLALGAVAGSAAGSIFGNELQARQEDLGMQDELLRRQEDTLRAQRKQLEELRALESDSTSRPIVALNQPVRRSVDASQNTWGNTPSRVKNNPIIPSKQITPQDNYSRSRNTPATHGKKLGEKNLIQEKKELEANSSSEQKEVVHEKLREEENASQKPSSIFSPLGSDPLVAPVEQLSEPEISQEVIEKVEKEVESVTDPEAQQVRAYMNGSGEVGLSQECEMAQQEVVKADDASEEAEKLFHYRRALRMCPENPAVHTSLGDIYRKSNRIEDARYEYKQALKISPNYAPALDSLKEID
jgi:tetratricopeptide (TPR) repeat protein